MQLIKEAQILSHGALVTRDVLVDQGKIVEVAPTIAPKADMTVYPAHGAFLTPGLVDVHVHFRDPGYTEKETIKTGSMAAAAGGFTTVLAMPNLNPVPDTVQRLQAQIQRNQADGVVHVGQYGAISADLTATEIADIKDMAAAGAVAFTNDGKGVQTAETMYQAMQAAAAVNKPLSAHLEDDSMLHGGVMNAGKRAEELGLPGITPLAESSQLARDLVLAQAAGVHYHVAHISTKASVELVRLAKQAGIKVTAEVSPHHLLLSENDITGDNALLKMNPPLRSEDDRQSLIAGLLDGTIDMIATDHAPHTTEEKAQSMRQAPFGITGIETSFALMYTHLVQSRMMDLATLVNRMLVKPVEAFNLEAPTEIKAGVAADLALFDLENQAEITADQFYSKGRNSPFIGWSVYGTTVATWVAGQQVFERN